MGWRYQPHLGPGLLLEAELTLQALAAAHGAGHGPATLDLVSHFPEGWTQPEMGRGEAGVDRSIVDGRGLTSG